MKVVVLTTSYPRFEGDAAGAFVKDQVDAVRAQGVEVEVVSPNDFRHFGIAYGHGIVGNLREAPWKALLLPAFLAAFARAARRAARGADVVHAHWLPSALVALASGKPYVLQLWGTDVELARRARALFRPLVRAASIVVVASESLAREAERLGARSIRVIPNPIPVPDSVRAPEQPPHVLFVGRLSPEKGILEFLDATQGMPRVVVGDGPLRSRVPEAVGFVERTALADVYARAAVVCVPSRREGYGMVVREAMGYGRAVVATRVGGLGDAIVDGRDGLLVEVGDAQALRCAIHRLLRDGDLRNRLGSAARERIRADVAHAAAELADAYADAGAGR